MELFLQIMIGVLIISVVYWVISSIRALFARSALDKMQTGDVQFKPTATLDGQKSGIGGGLYLVFLALLANTVVLIYHAYTDYQLLSADALAKDFIEQGIVPNANPYELFFNIRGIISVLLILASFYVIYLFLEKSASFPKFFKYLFYAFLVAIIGDNIAIHTIVDGMRWIDSIFLERDPLIVFILVFLVPYVNNSARSKSTFINR